MGKYIVSAGDESISVMARAHRQHIWNETELVGVSIRGFKQLNRFFEAHKHERIRVDATGYNPRLIGYYAE